MYVEEHIILAVSLWQEYAQFAIGTCSIPEVRAIIERGLNCVGLHVSQGSLLWDTLREFELAHLSLAQPETDDFALQMQRVIEVYKRQLSVPLLNMESTFKEWEDFIQHLPDDHGIDIKQVEWGYKKAQQLLESYKPFEESLSFAKDESEIYKIFMEYINFVKDPSLKIVLYERAVLELCLNVALWENYCCYTLKLGEVAIQICERALRNCPWHAPLWVARLRTLEKLGKSKEEIIKCFEEAIKSSSGDIVDVWLTYIEYIKRTSNDLNQIDKLCLQAKEQLQIYDKSTKLLKFQARIHANNGNMAIVRKLWQEIMSNISNNTSAYAWIEYLELEKRFGDNKHVRQLYQRAISKCKDWQQYFAEEWMMYEREIGSLDDVLKCSEKCKEIVKCGIGGSNTKDNDIKRKFDDEDDKYTNTKRHKADYHSVEIENGAKNKNDELHNSRNLKIQNAPVNIDTEKSVFLSNFVSKIGEKAFKEIFPNAKEITIPTDRKGKSRCFAYVLFETTDEAGEALKKDRYPIDGRPLFVSKCQKDRNQKQPIFKYSNKYEANKLFVKGLPKHYSKEQVEDIFKPYKVTEVRLVTKFNGQSKGLAYIDFANEEDAALALKTTDQMVFGEHTITVAISAPPPKKKDVVPVEKPNSRHSKTKLEIPFLPRSLQVKQHEPKETCGISKTNADFRKMLLGSK